MIATHPAWKILVVDGETKLCESIQRLIVVDFPHAVVTGAGSAGEALEAIAGGAFDLVLLDVRMPGKNVFETMREIRRRFGSALPVVIMSALRDDAYALAATRAGASAFLPKDRFPEELAGLVRSLTGTESSAAEGRTH